MIYFVWGSTYLAIRIGVRASWLNMVERFFRDLSPRTDCDAECFAISKNSSWPSEITSICKTRIPSRYLDGPASDILEKVKRARRALDKRHSA